MSHHRRTCLWCDTPTPATERVVYASSRTAATRVSRVCPEHVGKDVADIESIGLLTVLPEQSSESVREYLAVTS